MKKNKKSPFQWVTTALTILQLGKAGYDIFSGIKGKNDAKDKLKAAENSMRARKNDLINHDFRIQNPYEDIDVTTKASEIAKEQSAQVAADILARLAPNVGGSGAAALATAVARQSQKAAQAQQAKQEAIEVKLSQRAAGAQLAIDQSVNRAEYQRNADLFNLEAMGAAGAQADLNASQQQLNQGISQAINTGVSLLGNYIDNKKSKIDVPERVEPRTTADLPGGKITSSTDELLSAGSTTDYPLIVAKNFSSIDNFYSSNNNMFSNPMMGLKYYNYNQPLKQPNFNKGIEEIFVSPITSTILDD